jgi:hypothetical protein
MYPSGIWRGFWQQEGWGQQAMQDFELHFADGLVRGHGYDVVGRFTFAGEYETDTGHITLTKQYLGKHSVEYIGQPNGEGAIIGQWRCAIQLGDQVYETRGPFLLQPQLPVPTEHDPVYEIRPRSERD